jgi:murein DD-endopeptidase MepM/ murein hydrolase activator NlpD
VLIAAPAPRRVPLTLFHRNKRQDFQREGQKGKGNPLPFFVLQQWKRSGNMKRRVFLFALFLVLIPLIFGADTGEAPPYPLIRRLDPSDLVFRQYLEDVAEARRRLFTRDPSGGGVSGTETLTVYAYNPGADDDLFGLVARCNIPYSTLVTLNRLSVPGNLEAAGTLLLPSTPGLFIPETPVSDLERLIYSARPEQEGAALSFSGNGASERFRFIPGADFSPTERTFFLNPGFRYPLRSYRLTSSYGPRINPVTGNLRLHAGLDLAAPEGAEVYAVRDGTVTELGTDPIFGNFIIIQHSENWASLYGHLSKFETVLRSSVRSGSLIGRVGSTGQSTGPHLHFELRQNGRAQNPGRYLFTR